ncbi:benzoate 4-monooxygenase cytochrome p450 [Penicillium malachiteum]|nr:benzoate 4-monooxygenase cytochrome p450 [Penicillium malachiteum]
MKGQRVKTFQDAHQWFGPVIRVGPNAISFNDAKTVKDIYGYGSPFEKEISMIYSRATTAISLMCPTVKTTVKNVVSFKLPEHTLKPA